MKYIIKMEYITGDSFGSSEMEGQVELSWENLEIAKENLQRIKEHYQYYRERRNSFRKSEIEVLQKEASTKPWFCHEDNQKYISGTSSEYNIVLKLDDGTETNYYTGMWCGYFERLLAAEIIAEPIQDSDVRISFH